MTGSTRLPNPIASGGYERGLEESLGVGSDDEAREIEVRLRTWRMEFPVAAEFERFLLRQLVTESVRIERCQSEERAKLDEVAARAKRTWEADQRSLVHAIAAKLHRNPERWRNELLRSAHGCLWLVEQWNGLLEILGRKGAFDDRERSRALDLLGVPTLFREGRTPLDPAEGEEAVHDLSAKIRAEVEWLRREHERSLLELDLKNRGRAESGFNPEEDRRLQTVRRYEAGCRRRFDDLLRDLRSRESKGNRRRRSYLSPEGRFASNPRLEEVLRTAVNETERRSPAAVLPAEVVPAPEFKPEPELEPRPEPSHEHVAAPTRFGLRVDPRPEVVPPKPAGNRKQRRKAEALARRSGR